MIFEQNCKVHKQSPKCQKLAQIGHPVGEQRGPIQQSSGLM
jgi:hypothetical protein